MIFFYFSSCSLLLAVFSFEEVCHSYIQISIHALRQHEPTPLSFSLQGLRLYCTWCCLYSTLSWRGARGHGTADLLTEESDNHDLRGKRKLQLIITAETEQSDGVFISSKEYRTPTRITIQSTSLHWASSLWWIDLKGVSTLPPWALWTMRVISRS